MRKAGLGSLPIPVLVGTVLYLVLVVAMYHSTSEYLLTKWGMDDFTYAYFIMPVVAYLIWEKREELALHPSCRTWSGLLPAVLGILLYWLGELGAEYTVMFFSLWLLSFGAIWSLLGWRKLRVIAFPLVFALAMIPPPVTVYSNLTLQLKLISSQLGVQILQLCGMSAFREGNVIDVGFTKLQVVDACSGLRYFFPLIVLGILLAYFFRGALWKKILIVLTAIPVSIVTNSLRIASVGFLYQFMGPAAAEGFFHDFSGWFIFMVSLGILVLEMAVLKRIFPEQGKSAQIPVAESLTVPPSCPGNTQRTGLFRLVSPQFVLILLLMGATAVGAQGVATRDRMPLQKPFSEFPDVVAGWTGKRQVMEKMYLEVLGLNDYLLTDFHNGRGELINCYVGYNDSQTKGKAGHSPATCLTGNGWELKNPVKVRIQDSTGQILTVNRAVMVKGDERQITYYWFAQRGRILTELYQIKLYNFLDSITQKRTDGALVRLISPIAAGESAEAIDIRLKNFIEDLNPELTRFFPSVAKSLPSEIQKN